MEVVSPPPAAEPAVAELPAPKPAAWRQFRGPVEITAQASSEYPGWPVANVLDQDEKTSWFSNSNDSVTKGSQPWLLFSLSRPARLRLVKVLGNRNPTYPLGYSVTTLRMEALDIREKVIFAQETFNPAPPHDFIFLLEAPLAGVEGVRLVVLADEGAKNSYGDVALGEVSFEFSQEEK